MDLDRARRAQALLNDADAKAALDAMEQGIFAAWKAALAAEDRERLWHEMRAISLFRDKLKSFASDLSFATAAERGTKGDAR